MDASFHRCRGSRTQEFSLAGYPGFRGRVAIIYPRERERERRERERSCLASGYINFERDLLASGYMFFSSDLFLFDGQYFFLTNIRYMIYQVNLLFINDMYMDMAEIH